MHDTALEFGKLFFETYIDKSKLVTIADIGSMDVNGSLRSVAPKDSIYIGIDLEKGKGVDRIMKDPYLIPLENNSVDIVVSSSSFEHIEFFWITFNEILRVLSKNGIFYLNTVSNGSFHQYPRDYYRFYPDSGLALCNWGKKNDYQVCLLESFIGCQKKDRWNDFVAVFQKSSKPKDSNHPTILEKINNFTNGYNYKNLVFDKKIINFSEKTEDQNLIDLKDIEILNLKKSLDLRDQEVIIKNNQIKKILKSNSWKVTAPLRYIKSFFKKK